MNPPPGPSREYDPPVIAFQSASASHFVSEVVAMHQPGPRSPVDVVHEDVSSAIWAHGGFVSQAAATASEDSVLREFAAGFPPEAIFADLLAPNIGDGFAWGRFGPRLSRLLGRR